MKKTYITIFILVSCFASIFANVKPVAPFIKKLYVYESNWKVTLVADINESYFSSTRIDSAIFRNKTQQVTYIPQSASEGKTITILSDSLPSILELQKEGDFFYAELFASSDEYKWRFSDSVRFGNIYGASVRAPKSNEYISSFSHNMGSFGYWHICNNSTCAAVIKGTIYSSDGSPLKNATFNCLQMIYYDECKSFTTDQFGNYSYEVYSDTSHTIKYLGLESNRYDIVPFTYQVSPGDIITQDIYLKDDYVSIEPEKKLAQFFCFPAPAKEKISFAYSITDIRIQKGEIKIYDSQGAFVDMIEIKSNEGSVEYLIPSHLSAGSYYYTVESEHRTIYKGQFFIHK